VTKLADKQNPTVVMKKLLLSLLTVTSLIVTANAQFAPGNLAVLRLGNGTETLANTGNSVFIDQFTPLGSYVNSTAILNSGASALVMSGTATSEGSLTRSTDGRYLTFAGYNTTAGIPYASSLPATSASLVPRAVGQVNDAGSYNLVTTTTAAYGGTSSTAGNPRSVITDGANNYWGVGTSSSSSTRGTYYYGTASSPAWIEGTKSPRVINMFGGNLYYSVSSGAAGASGIWGFSGQPTSGPLVATQLIDTGVSSGNYDFALNSAMTLVYVADDRASASGGIQRWDWSGSSWSLTYTLGTGVANVGARGLAVDFSGADPVIYATTAEGTANRLITITDLGGSSVATTLATAPANEIFRGLDFTPIPEPATTALLGIGLLLFCYRFRRLRRS
jgi:hypothetical protein